MMKNLQFLMLLLFMAFGSFAQQYGWVALTSPNASGLFRNIYVSGNEAWLLNNNAIYYSNNYPTTQFSQIYTPSNTLNAMYFTIQGGLKYGWAVGNSSLGARTTDGTNWTSMSLGGTSNYQCVSFPTTSLGIASGTDKRLHKTVNGGANWTDAGVTLGFGTVNTLFFVDSTTGYEGTSDPRLAKTSDGGATWIDEGEITGTISDIYFYDSTHGWAVGASDILYYNNSTWAQLNNTSAYPLYAVFFLNQNEGWIVGDGGTILHSTDGGATWTNQSSGTNVTLRDVFFTSSTNGYAVGNNGTILHYTQITGVEDHPTQPTAFNLEQNFPNPFNSVTKISYSLSIPAQVQLTVCNMFGQQVALLNEGFKPAGSFSADFTGDDLPSGIYYYHLQCGDRHETRKMTLIK
jgi:photosystem II stability/assembly factor-like uncharacterized protein